MMPSRPPTAGGRMHIVDQGNIRTTTWVPGSYPSRQVCGPWRIVLCHHEPAARSSIRGVLTRDGIEVHEATDTFELLDLLGERGFDAAVTSIDPAAHTRGDLDGLQALQTCRSAGLSVPFIVLHDNPDLRVFHAITRVRGAASLRAPFSPTDLVRLIEELGRGGLSDNRANWAGSRRRSASGGVS